MNHEVEREEGELAKLRRLRERVMALPRYIVWTEFDGLHYEPAKDREKSDGWIRAADVDALLEDDPTAPALGSEQVGLTATPIDTDAGSDGLPR